MAMQIRNLGIAAFAASVLFAMNAGWAQTVQGWTQEAANTDVRAACSVEIAELRSKVMEEISPVTKRPVWQSEEKFSRDLDASFSEIFGGSVDFLESLVAENEQYRATHSVPRADNPAGDSLYRATWANNILLDCMRKQHVKQAKGLIRPPGFQEARATPPPKPKPPKVEEEPETQCSIKSAEHDAVVETYNWSLADSTRNGYRHAMFLGQSGMKLLDTYCKSEEQYSIRSRFKQIYDDGLAGCLAVSEGAACTPLEPPKK
jgi:hypothetical protein